MYAQANLEIPMWGALLGTDPRTGQEVWDPILDENGRQQTTIYRRGDLVDQSKFRQSDWDTLITQGALGDQAPPEDIAPGGVVSPTETAPTNGGTGAQNVQIASTEGAATTDTGSAA